MPAKRDIPKTTSQFLIGVVEKTRSINEEVEKIRAGRGSFLVLAGAIDTANKYLEKSLNLLPRFRISPEQKESVLDLVEKIRELNRATEPLQRAILPSLEDKRTILEMASGIEDFGDSVILGVGSMDRMSLSVLRVQDNFNRLKETIKKYAEEVKATETLKPSESLKPPEYPEPPELLGYVNEIEKVEGKFISLAGKADEISVEDFLTEMREVYTTFVGVHDKMRDTEEITLEMEKSFSEIGGRMKMMQGIAEKLQGGYSGMTEKVQQITNSFGELRRHGRGYTNEIDTLIKRTEDLGKNIETMTPREALREFNLINREAVGLQRNMHRSGKEIVAVRREFLGIFNQIRGIKQEATFQGVERLAGMANVKGFIQQISNIPGLQGLGALAGIIPGGISVAAISAIIGTFVTEWDKMIDSARKMRESLAVVGAEGWRAGVMEMTRLRIGLEAQMRALTNSAAGAEEAMNILSQLKDVGGFTELTFKGERVADMMDRLGEGMERGDTGEVVNDLSRRLAYLSAGLNNLSSATGVSEGEILKQAMTLSRFTDTNERDIETLTETWFTLSYTANKANVSMRDYVGWVEQGVQRLRFFGFTINDVNAIAYKYNDELRRGIVSMDDLNNMITQTVSPKHLAQWALLDDALKRNIDRLDEQTPGMKNFIVELRRAVGPEGFPMILSMIAQGAEGFRGVKMMTGIDPTKYISEQYRTTERLNEFGRTLTGFMPEFTQGMLEQVGGANLGMRMLAGRSLMPTLPGLAGFGEDVLIKGGLKTEMWQSTMKMGTEKGLELQREARGQFNELNNEFSQFRDIQSTIAEGMAYLKSAVVGTETMGVRIMEVHASAREAFNESLTEETGK